MGEQQSSETQWYRFNSDWQERNFRCGKKFNKSRLMNSKRRSIDGDEMEQERNRRTTKKNCCAHNNNSSHLWFNKIHKSISKTINIFAFWKGVAGSCINGNRHLAKFASGSRALIAHWFNQNHLSQFTANSFNDLSLYHFHTLSFTRTLYFYVSVSNKFQLRSLRPNIIYLLFLCFRNAFINLINISVVDINIINSYFNFLSFQVSSEYRY